MKKSDDARNPRGELSPELTARAKTGDQAAFTELYEITSPILYRSVRAMVREEDLTWDIMQDSYLRAFQNLGKLEANEAFLPWLRRIAIHVTADKLSQKLPLTFTDLAGEEAELPELPELRPEAQPELALDRKESSRLVREILAELPAEQHLILGMRYYEELSVREISELLKIAPGTVKAQLFRGRKKVETKVRALEKKGIKLYGLSPMAYLNALLRRLEPAEESRRQALGTALPHLTAAGTAVTALSLGRALAGKLAAGALALTLLGGGLWLGGRLLREREPELGDVRPTESRRLDHLSDDTRELPELTLASETGEAPLESEPEPGTSGTEPTEPSESTEPSEEAPEPSREETPPAAGGDQPNRPAQPAAPRPSEEESPEPSREETPRPSEEEPEPSRENTEPPTSAPEPTEPTDPPGTVSNTLSNGVRWQLDVDEATLRFSPGEGYDPASSPSRSRDAVWQEYGFGTDLYLEKIVVEEGVEALGTLFHTTIQAERVELPSTLRYLNRYGVDYQQWIDWENPENVVSIQAMTAYEVARGNPWFSSRDGVLYSADQTHLIRCPARRSGSFTVPAGVRVLENSAFASCAVQELQLPASLETVGTAAFTNSKLTALTLPESVRSFGSYVFFGCGSLRAVRLPQALEHIGWQSFLDCGALTDVTLPTALKEIETELFSGCGSLKELTIPEDVTAIDGSAFQDCAALSQLTIPASVQTISSDACVGCPRSMVIRGVPGSAAEQFAQEQVFVFEAME